MSRRVFITICQLNHWKRQLNFRSECFESYASTFIQNAAVEEDCRDFCWLNGALLDFDKINNRLLLMFNSLT